MAFKVPCTVLCIIYLLAPAQAQLSICREPLDLFKFKNFELKDEFDFDFFLENEFPKVDQVKIRYDVIGHGGFGVVIRLTLIDKERGGDFDVALKILKYTEAQMERVDKEIQIYKEMSWKHPLSAPIFLECAHDARKQVVFIITEKIDYSLDSSTFKERPDMTPLLYLKILLMMSRTLLDLHLMGYVHCDIKPDNYLMRVDEPFIVKLIDFGMMIVPGTRFMGGTYSFKDPMNFNTKIVTRKNDIYSLGMSFLAIVNTPIFVKVKVKKVAVLKKIETRNAFFEDRRTTLINFFRTRELYYSRNNVKYNDVFSLMNELTKQMTTNTFEGRIELLEVTQRLEGVLRKYEPDSIYLEKNLHALFKQVYKVDVLNYRRFQREYDSNIESSSVTEDFHITGVEQTEWMLPADHNTFLSVKRMDTYREFDNYLKEEVRLAI